MSENSFQPSARPNLWHYSGLEPVAGEPRSAVTTNGYDEMRTGTGWKRWKNYLETINYRYDLQGNVLEEVSPLGKTEYRYNALNQQTAVFMKDGGILENQYDAEYLRAEVAWNYKMEDISMI